MSQKNAPIKQKKWPNIAGLSTFQRGPKGPKMVNLDVFHNSVPFWAHLDTFGPLWNVDKPAMFGHFCLFYWCVFLGHPVYISMSILSMSILMSMLASSNCSEQWVPASLAPCSDLCAGWSATGQPATSRRLAPSVIYRTGRLS